MGKAPSLLKMVDGLAFELLSTLMVLNLYPLGIRRDKDPKLLTYRSQKRPVLLVHGIFHNRSAFFGIRRRLKRMGWDHIYTIDLSTYKKGIPELAEQMSHRIDMIIRHTKAKKVDIIAHSLGGMISRYYIQCLKGHKKIKHCVTLGTPHGGTWLSKIGIGKSIKDIRKTARVLTKLKKTPLPKSVKFTSFWSSFDTMVWPQCQAKMKPSKKNPQLVQNVKVHDAGHAGLLFSKEVCYKIASLLDAPRKYPTIIENRRSHFKLFPLYSFRST